MFITRTVLSLIVFSGGVAPSFSEPITLQQPLAHELMASSATDVRDANGPAFNVNDELSAVIGALTSGTPQPIIRHEAADPVPTTGSNGMRTALAGISEPASLLLMGGVTVGLAAYVTRRQRRHDGRLWERRRSRRRGYY